MDMHWTRRLPKRLLVLGLVHDMDMATVTRIMFSQCLTRIVAALHAHTIKLFPPMTGWIRKHGCKMVSTM